MSAVSRTAGPVGGPRRPGDAPQGGSAADHRPRPVRRRHLAPGHAVGGDRPLARGARQDHLDRRLGGARAPRRPRGVHRPGPDRPRRPAADGVGAAGRRGQQPRALAARPRTPSSTSATRSRSCSATIATRSSTRPRTWSSSTSRCRSSPTPRRRSRAAPFVHEQLGTNKVHEWSLPGRRRRGRVRRGRRRGRAARRQPPHRRRADRAARGARRLPRRLADAVDLDPGAALRAAVPGDPARDERGAGARDRARGRRRLRLQAPGVRRGGPRLLVLAQARAPGEVDRDADREHGGHPPGPRPDRARARWAPSATARSPPAT